MKDTVQIKAELFEGQHDALIAFYESYPRLFVNKLLLRLCEAFMPTYKPNLALFQPHPEVASGKARKIAIRLEKDKCPLFWQFYKDLPYGSRVLVIVNLMNNYVQMVESNRALLEHVYWRGSINELPADPKIADTQSAVKEELGAVDSVRGSLASSDQRGSAGQNAEEVVADSSSPVPLPLADPLEGLDVQL